MNKNTAQIHSLMVDVHTHCLEGGINPALWSHLAGLVSKKKEDPDYPRFHQAMAGPHRAEFQIGMKKEIKELEERSTWTVVKRSSIPEGANVLPVTWAFRIKRFPTGLIQKFKARFCVRGDKQVEGVDFFDTYAPVVSWTTIRLLLVLKGYLGLATKQVDFSNAFAQADVKEKVYVELPKGFEPPSDGDHVLKLNKSLYGLRQAPLNWFEYLSVGLRKHGFEPSKLDPCLFIHKEVICLVYVDDCLFFARNATNIDIILEKLKNYNFVFTVEKSVEAFLGVQVDVDEETGVVKMSQPGLIDKIVKTVGLSNCAPKATPANVAPLGSDKDGPECGEPWNYASVVGMLLYVSSNTRPDIQFAVHQCARHTHAPKKSHEDAIKRIVRYLSGTRDKGVSFQPSDDPVLDCYVDADFAGLWSYEDKEDPVCVRSRTGYVLTFGGCPLLWVSKLQTEVALSTTEAEYIALLQAIRDLLPT